MLNRFKEFTKETSEELSYNEYLIKLISNKKDEIKYEYINFFEKNYKDILNGLDFYIAPHNYYFEPDYYNFEATIDGITFPNICMPILYQRMDFKVYAIENKFILAGYLDVVFEFLKECNCKLLYRNSGEKNDYFLVFNEWEKFNKE